MSSYTEQGIIEGLRSAVKDLEKSLSENGGARTEHQTTTVLLALTRGVLLSLDKHASCPALNAYVAFRKWAIPVLFGLVLAAFAGGLYAFQRFGLAVPGP